MGNYNKNCISVNDFQNNCSQQIPYEGYVEGLGYASVIYHYTMAKRKYYGEPESYFANIVREQRLEISQDTISRSQDVDMHIAKKQSNSGKIMTATIAVSGFLIADDVTGIGIADDIAIPFILAGGTIIATIAYLYEKSVGQGNKTYPGPWSETQLDKGTMQRQYGYEPVPEPPYEKYPGGKIGVVVTSAILAKQVYEGSKLQNKTTVDVMNQDTLRREQVFMQGRFNNSTPNFTPILNLNKLIEREQQRIKQDNTSVVMYDRLIKINEPK